MLSNFNDVVILIVVVVDDFASAALIFTAAAAAVSIDRKRGRADLRRRKKMYARCDAMTSAVSAFFVHSIAQQ